MASQQNVINDLGTVTRVSNKILNPLFEKLNLCIGSAIHDALMANEETTQLNIGIGTLSIELKTMQCKFIPSKELKTAIKRSIENKIDPLEFELEQTLKAKLIKIIEEEM